MRIRGFWLVVIAVVLITGLVFGAAACSQQQPAGGATEKKAEKPAEKAADKAADKAAAGDKYPNKPIKLILPNKAGGTTDIPARLLQPFLDKALGVSTVIENIDGGGGAIARTQAYNAKPDGYTLLFSQHPSITASAIISGGFDPLKFIPIYNIKGQDVQGIAVPYDSPYKSFKEFIEAAKTKPHTVSSAGVGNVSSICILFLEKKTGAKLQQVPFNNSNEVALAIAGKQVNAGSTNYSAFVPLEEQKKVRLLVTMGKQRAPFAPNVPTAIEQGINVAIDQIGGFFGPPDLPKDKVDFLAAAIDKAAKDPGFQAKAQESKESLKLMGPEEFKKEYIELHELTMDIKDQLLAIQKK